MPLKLGELLLREKIITPEQLEEALKKHVFYGIKLGSSLVELGYVEEEQLAILLSEKLGVPRVGRKEVLSAPMDVIQLIHRDIAGKHRMIPYYLERKQLSVAMSDPTDYKVIDEIGFITGKVLKVHIAPDVVISKALAKFYHVSEAESRYQQVEQVALKRRKINAPPQTQTVTFQIPSESGELLQVTVPAEFDGFGSLPDPPEYAADYMGPVAVPAMPETPMKPAAPLNDQEPQPNYSVDQISIDFAAVNSREELADVFIRYLGMDFEIGGLFVVYGNDAIGWRGMSHGNRLAAFEKFNINLSKASALRDVVESRKFFMGVLPENPSNRQILFLLKAAADTPLLVLPVVMLEEVVAVVMVSVYEKNFRWRLMVLENLVRKMSLVFEKLIIKHKILLT